jgi:hypothetical protein
MQVWRAEVCRIRVENPREPSTPCTIVPTSRKLGDLDNSASFSRLSIKMYTLANPQTSLCYSSRPVFARVQLQGDICDDNIASDLQY